MVRIAGIEAGSIAEELELEIGTRIVRINGERVRDNIDLTFLLAEPELEIETVDDDTGEGVIYEIVRDPGEAVGIVPTPDTIRECANKCVFCFIDGNPQGVRNSLWLRDDDFRLSFTYGSYVTLTNLGPRGIQRLLDQRISPLYVSVHATEPQVRIDLLKNERAGLIMEHLRTFAEHDLEVHTQVVLCPGWNDGAHLDRTIDDLWGLGAAVRSLSVVPVGLTRYNLNRPVRLLTAGEAVHAIDQVERARGRALAERGEGWCYAADEMFLIAGHELPAPDYYDDGSLTENGVGAVRALLDDLDAALQVPTDAPTDASPDALQGQSPGALPRLDGRRLRIATGSSMAPFFRERASALAERTGAAVDVVEVANDFFGPTVGVAGLLAGGDLVRALAPGTRADDVVLLPAEALNAERLFIDSVPLAHVEASLAPARVEPGHRLSELLRRL